MDHITALPVELLTMIFKFVMNSGPFVDPYKKNGLKAQENRDNWRLVCWKFLQISNNDINYLIQGFRTWRTRDRCSLYKFPKQDPQLRSKIPPEVLSKYLLDLYLIKKNEGIYSGICRFIDNYTISKDEETRRREDELYWEIYWEIY
jgi:hypothetical protein